MAKRSLFSRIAGAVRDTIQRLTGSGPKPTPAPVPKLFVRKPIINEPIPKSIPKMTYTREPEGEKVLVGSRYVEPRLPHALAPAPGSGESGVPLSEVRTHIPHALRVTAEELRDLVQNEKNVILTPREQELLIETYFYKGEPSDYEVAERRSNPNGGPGFVTPEAAMNYAAPIPDGVYQLLKSGDGRYYVVVTGS